MSDTTTSIGVKKTTYQKLNAHKIAMITEKGDTNVSFSDVIDDLLARVPSKGEKNSP